MKNRWKGWTSTALVLAFTAISAQAGTVDLTGFKWGYNEVEVRNVAPGSPAFPATVVRAGGFAGTVSGFGAPFEGALITYCVEFTETFSFGSLAGYSLVAGASYGHWGADSAAIAQRLGALMTYVNGLSGGEAVDSAVESAAVQLAVWETIYEKPTGNELGLMDGNFVESKTGNDALRSLASGYLGASAATVSAYDVFVLTKERSQDFLLLRERPVPATSLDVPEPGAAALSLAALLALGAARRRRTGDA